MKTGYELLVSLDWQTIIIQLINLGIQILLFKKFLYKPVMKILRKRQGLVDQPLKEAEAAKQEALSMKQEYEANLSKANEEADRIVKEASAAASQKSERIVSDAQEEVAALKAQAQLDIAAQRSGRSMTRRMRSAPWRWILRPKSSDVRSTSRTRRILSMSSFRM